MDDQCSPSGGTTMRIRTLLGTAAAATAALAVLAGCGGSKTSGQAASAQAAKTAPTSRTPSAPPPATAGTSTPAPSTAPSTSSARLTPALIQLSDLPSGFRSEGLTQRNLPGLIKGCAGLEVLQQSNIADQA